MEAKVHLQEYEQIRHRMYGIPERVRKLFSLEEVHFTCIDAIDEFLAIGTNIGTVYWCNRRTNEVKRLRGLNNSQHVSTVNVVSTVDYQIAIGYTKGVVICFSISKTPTPHIGGTKRFVISNLHPISAAISASEWSVNGEKLFSGDSNGIVGMSQMDYELGIMKSVELMKESDSIINLKYRDKILLICTRERCILVDQQSNILRAFYSANQSSELYNNSAFIGASFGRSSREIITACANQQLYFYGENSQTTAISITESLSTAETFCPNEATFRRIIYSKSDELIIVYCERGLAVITTEFEAISGIRSFDRIVSVASNDVEILVLDGSRRIRRISDRPCPFAEHSKNSHNNTFGTLVSEVTSNLKQEVMGRVFPFFKEINRHANRSANREREVLLDLPVNNYAHVGGNNGKIPIIELSDECDELDSNSELNKTGETFQASNSIAEVSIEEIAYDEFKSERAVNGVNSNECFNCEATDPEDENHPSVNEEIEVLSNLLEDRTFPKCVPKITSPTRPTEIIASKYENQANDRVYCREGDIVICLVLSDKVAYYITSFLCVYRCEMEHFSRGWIKESFRSSWLSISMSGNIIWKLEFGIASALFRQSHSLEWRKVARNVISIAVGEEYVWYVRDDGKVYILNNSQVIPICNEALNIACDSKVAQVRSFLNNILVVASDGKLFARDGVTDSNPYGLAWRYIPSPITDIPDSISLTCRDAAWISKNGSIWFADNLFNSERDCVWWRIDVTETFGFCEMRNDNRRILVASNSDRIWIYDSISGACHVCESVVGYIWRICYAENNWKLITASGMYKDIGLIWLISENGGLYRSNLAAKVFIKVALPIDIEETDEIICVAALYNLLWILTKSGRIFGRNGDSEITRDDVHWKEIFVDISSGESRIVWLTLGYNSVWVLTDDGTPHLLTDDSPYDILQKGRAFAENACQGSTINFQMISVGATTKTVWGVTSDNSVYVAENANVELLNWILVPGILAKSVIISGMNVWVVSTEKYLYKRLGVSENNCQGDWWLRVTDDVRLNQVSVTLSEDLWSTNMACHLMTRNTHTLHTRMSAKDDESEDLLEEWEIVDYSDSSRLLNSQVY